MSGATYSSKLYLQWLYFIDCKVKNVNWLAPIRLLAFIILLCIAYTGLTALELPITFEWNSLSSGYYTKAQTSKDISWDEFYRVNIKVDSLSYMQSVLDVHVRSRADFLSNYVELNKIRLSYFLSNWSLSAGSKSIGYGARVTLNPYYLITPDMDNYPYQESRFNGAEVSYRHKEAVLIVGMGGNVHNQAMALLNAKWQKSDGSLGMMFTQEARAMDSFWRTPVSITALSINLNAPVMKLHTETAISYYPSHDLTKEHFSTFNQANIALLPAPGNFLYVSAEANQLEPSGKTLKHLYGSYNKDIGAFALSPGISLNMYDGVSSYAYQLLAEWRLAPQQRLGIIYRWEDNENISGRHFVGVQAELCYGI